MKKILAALLLSMMLAGCGFHLRGYDDPQPFAFQKLNIVSSSGLLLTDILHQQLSLRKELVLVPRIDGADAVLRIDQEGSEKQVFTVNASGQVTQYTVYYHARFSLRIGANEVIEPTTLKLQRILIFNVNAVLGKDVEEQRLIADMRTDMAQQIIRRISAIKPINRTVIPVPATTADPSMQKAPQ